MIEKPRFILKELSRHKIGTSPDIIYRNALLYSNRLAFISEEGRSVTFWEYNRRLNSLIRALWDGGIKKGDVVGVVSENCSEFMEVIGAGRKAAIRAIPFDPTLWKGELEFLINDSQANTLFVLGSKPRVVSMVEELKSQIPRVKRFISFQSRVSGMEFYDDLLASYPDEEFGELDINEDDVAWMIYSSGTTGYPRAAYYDYKRRDEHLTSWLSELRIVPEDINLIGAYKSNSMTTNVFPIKIQ